MNEEQKIEKLMKEYKELFETTTADITKSYKGQQFFFYTDRVSGDFYCIQKFKTAEELEKIILYEMADQINMSLEKAIEAVKKKIDNIDNSDCSNQSMSISQLVESLGVIQKEMCQFIPFIQSLLQGISTSIEKYKES